MLVVPGVVGPSRAILCAGLPLDRTRSRDMVHQRNGHCDLASEAVRAQPTAALPSLSIETIGPCRISSANSACATLTSPTVSASRRCANILRSTASPTIGISPILPRARSAARRWCSPRLQPFRLRAEFPLRTWALEAKSISSRWSGSRASSILKARALASNSRTLDERAAPIGLESGKALLRKAMADGVPSRRAQSRSAIPTPSRMN